MNSLVASNLNHMSAILLRRYAMRSTWLISMVVLTIAVSVLSLSLGSFHWQWDSVWTLLANGNSVTREQQLQWYVLWELRIPRTLLAACVGALLGMAGCAMQGLVRNPLADPGLIGISGGAAAAAAASMALPWAAATQYGALYTTVAAFIGALITAGLVLSMAKRSNGISVGTLILAGVAINALTGTVIGAVSYIASDDALRQISYWTMGSLAGANWQHVALLLSVVVVAGGIFMLCRNALNLFSLGEQEAAYQGLNVKRYKLYLLWTVALAVALCTALCGMIGFIGLVIPHICRTLVGVDHRFLMPASGLLGAGILVFSDVLSRSLFTPLEIPIGIITSAVGAPFFLYLLAKRRGQDVD